MFKKLLLLFAPFLLAGLALAGAWTWLGKPGGAPATAPSKPVPVVVSAAAVIDFALEIEAVGQLRAQESVTLTAELTDTVKAVHFEDGDEVAQGKLLVELDDTRLLAELAEARALLAEQRRRFGRTEALTRQGVTAQAESDAREAEKLSAEARVRALEARLRDTRITAPFAGRLGFRRVSVGGLVTPGAVVATLDDLRLMKLDVPVPESFAGEVRPGLEVEARAAAWPDRTFRGRVTAVDTRLDPATRSLTLRVDLPNPERELLPNMLMTVRVKARPRRALVVPEHALVPLGERQYVLLVEPDAQGLEVARRVEVRLGMRKPGLAEIQEGLSPGQRVVVEGVNRVRPGGAVRVVDEKPLEARGSAPAPAVGNAPGPAAPQGQPTRAAGDADRPQTPAFTPDAPTAPTAPPSAPGAPTAPKAGR